MCKALEAARWLCLNVDHDAGSCMSPLKLQKLLYFAQGHHLALYDEPLFEEPIEAWVGGPTVSSVWDAYLPYIETGILEEGELPELSRRTEALLSHVYDRYGIFEAPALQSMIANSKPWAEAGVGFDTVDTALMKEHFKGKIG